MPTEQGIRDIDDWLCEKYGKPVNDYNGSPCSPGDVEILAREYGGFADSYLEGGWDLIRLREEIDAGHPVIVIVTVNPARFCGGGYQWGPGHSVVAIGYTSTHIICNNPGRDGHNKYYPNDQFLLAMSDWTGTVVVVLPPALASAGLPFWIWIASAVVTALLVSLIIGIKIKRRLGGR